MPGNTFIKFGGDVPKGESLQKSHPGDKGWIEIADWSWDIDAAHSVTKGTGAAVGKANPGVLTINHYFDISSPTILSKIVAGQHFPEITIEMLKQTGKVDVGPEVYFQVKAVEAFVTKVSTNYNDGEFNQQVDFVFKEISLGYKAQKNLGGLESSIPFDWSITTMTLVTKAKDKLK